MVGIRKEDIEDVEIVDAEELAADGSTSYLSGVSVTSTTTGTKVVVFPPGTNLPLTDDPVESGDTIILAGTSGGADGTYTVDVVSNDSLTVVEAIVSSTGGTAEFRHPAGAKKVGVDPTSLPFTTDTDLQAALEDVKAHVDGSVVVGTSGIQVGVLATDAQHGVRGGGTQHALVTPNPSGAAGFQAPADKHKQDQYPFVHAANWVGTRYYAVDYDNGSDSNLGYGATMAAAGAVALKTIEGLQAIFPHHGRGQKVVVAIRNRAGGAVYRNQADSADANMDFLKGVVGYQYILVRGTGTVATAGATAFANDAADKICCGAQIVPGTSATGYEPTGSPTTSVFTCQITGGGAPGLAAEPSLIGKRIRFDSATTTVGLRNQCRMIHANTTDTITLAENLSATPVTTDVFYIEEPGVAFDRIILSSGDGGSQAVPPSFVTNGVSVVGLRSPNTGAAHAALYSNGFLGSVNFCFIDIASPATGAFGAQGPGSLNMLVSYVDETDASVRAGGPSVRTVGWWTISRWNAILVQQAAATSGRPQLTNIQGAINFGAGSYFGVGVLAQNCRTATGTVSTIGGNLFGNGASSTVRRMRSLSGFAGASLGLTNTDAFVRGVDITQAGALACIQVQGNGLSVVINDVVGSTGNTGPGLDLTLTRDSNILMGQLNANTFTGAAGRDIEGVGPVRYVHADYALTDLFDRGRNVVQGPTSTKTGHVVLVTNDGTAAVGKYKVLRATGSGTARAAQADSQANASGVIGVSQSAFTAAPVELAMAVDSGGTWIQFDSTPTVGSVAYLSTATAGNAQVAAPAQSGTNQKLRLGIVSRVSGTLGFVNWQAENTPSLADGAAMVVKSQFYLVNANAGTDKGDYNTVSVGANASITMTFRCPFDFVSLRALRVLLICPNTITSQPVDLTSDYATVGENFQTHSESQSISVSFTADQVSEINVAGVFNSLAANDVGGVKIKHNAIGSTVNYLGMLLEYESNVVS